MKKKLCLLLSAIMVASVGTIPHYVSAADDAFISGYEDGTFRPDEKMTRAEAASMMAQLISGKSAKDVSFADVSTETWYYGALAELNSRDMLNSYGSIFEGNKNITRLEFAEFIYIYKNGYKAGVTREDMFTNLTASGIILGYDDGTYRQNSELTRAEAVALVNRITGKTVNKEGAKQVFDDVTSLHWAYGDIFAATASKIEVTGKKMVNDPVWGDNIQYQPGVTYPIAPPADQATKQMDKFNEKGSEWVTVGMINDDLRAQGVTIGSDGAQRPNALTISSDGQLLLVGHDTSLIHRSTDGGKTWQKAGKGMFSHGAANLVIDPNNKNRVIGVGTHHDKTVVTNGIYLSEDGGDTFNQVLSQACGAGQLELKTSVCWDASSFDEELGGSAIAYWSKNYKLHAPSGWYSGEPPRDLEAWPNEKEGLWKTVDGGYTWEVVNPDFCDSVVAVHPETGVLYAGNERGFFRSEDGGVTFENILSGSMIYSIDVISTEPDSVYVQDHMGVLVSRDSGKAFTRIEAKNFPQGVSKTNPYQSVMNLKVSPINPQNMVVGFYSGFGAYDSRIYYSNDGGVSWMQSVEDHTGYFFTSNDREAMLVWDPTDGNKVWGFVGDYVSCSTDAGATFKWAADGMCDFFIDQRSMFSLYDPDVMYFGSQDFHGALTRDNGKNWKHIDAINGKGSYAGFVYGSYATHDGHMIAGNRVNGQTLDLIVSHDWGETWTNTGIKTHVAGQKWLETMYQSPTDENVLLVGSNNNGYRSTDKGYTWEQMDVEVVHCHNPYGKKEMYGVKGDEIYVSYDSGATWEFFWKAKCIPPAEKDSGGTATIWDMAYDGINNILYYIGGVNGSGRYFCKVQNGVETDLTATITAVAEDSGLDYAPGELSVQLCTVDPRYPQVLYVGGYRSGWKNPSGVMRSVDYGETWQVLSNTNHECTIVKTGPLGGIEPYDLIVHPVTGELWVPQGCAGWSKIAPPYENN